MKQLEYKRSGERPDSEEVEAVSELMVLPESYIGFLAAGFGGLLSDVNCYVELDYELFGDVDIHMRELFPIKYKDKNHWLLDRVEFFQADLPEGFIAIGNDQLGNLLLIETSEKEESLVFFDLVRFRNRKTTSKAVENCPYLVRMRETFSEFVEMLGPL